ncbi:hypothetical protein CPLU01_11778 [Colletotrichum plurivorum]|uniref:Uncharacterized protein n=1 Tax=Colletotrichum plurivorum TaxID=2175906 RepID=A0A8H6N802_9PEZI|nr:hypothetical protein CPLU01_11778 [Colletotrichum plurivorum]
MPVNSSPVSLPPMRLLSYLSGSPHDVNLAPQRLDPCCRHYEKIFAARQCKLASPERYEVVIVEANGDPEQTSGTGVEVDLLDI